MKDCSVTSQRCIHMAKKIKRRCSDITIGEIEALGKKLNYLPNNIGSRVCETSTTKLANALCNRKSRRSRRASKTRKRQSRTKLRRSRRASKTRKRVSRKRRLSRSYKMQARNVTWSNRVSAVPSPVSVLTTTPPPRMSCETELEDCKRKLSDLRRTQILESFDRMINRREQLDKIKENITNLRGNSQWGVSSY